MNRINSRMIVLAVILAVVALTAGAEVAGCQTGKEIRGLPNFGRVTDTLYRGGQPGLDGFTALQAMGVGIVVNFRDERGEMAAEKRQVESLGMKYVGIPWSGHDEPSSAQVVEFLDLIRANPKAKTPDPAPPAGSSFTGKAGGPRRTVPEVMFVTGALVGSRPTASRRLQGI